MITTELLTQAASAWLKDTKCYLVRASVNGEDLEVLIDCPEGVDMDQCAELNRQLQAALGAEVDDYNLMVGSAGLTEPMLVPRQYMQHLGDPVEVLTQDGRKLHGTMTDATDEDFEIEWTTKEKQEGQKKKVEVSHQERFRFSEIKYCVYDLKV